MRYLTFDSNGVLVSVNKHRSNEDDLEVSETYNFQKQVVQTIFDKETTILIDKTKDEIINDLFPKLTDEELNKQRISLIKIKSVDIIQSKYPIYKQLNITNLLDGYTQEDKTKMIDFINSIRAISNKAELEGTALEDIDWGTYG